MYSTPYSKWPVREISLDEAPPLLKHIPKAPDKLFVVGTLPSPIDGEYVYLTIVGSRKYSEYAKQACESLIAGLRGLPVIIVSGLALGIDSIAHTAAIKNGLRTIAVPGSGLDENVLYPPTHLGLATEILERGGALISHFENDTVGAPWTFPNRNRIMAGISQATLVIEADIKSGTLITSKFAGEFNRDVLAVPGSIFSSQTAGPHMLIRKGAVPITCADDLREALGFKESDSSQNSLPLYDIDMSLIEKSIIGALKINLSRDRLFEILMTENTDLGVGEINAAISMLEIKGLIEYCDGEFRLRLN